MKPTPGSQLALFATYSYHGFITDRDGDTLELEADHRRHAEVENAIRDLKHGVGLNHLPSGRFAATAPGWRCRCWPITWPAGQRASVWERRRPPPRPSGGGSSLSSTAHPLGTPPHPASSKGWPWQYQFRRALARAASNSIPSLTARPHRPHHPDNRTSPQTRAGAGPRVSLVAWSPRQSRPTPPLWAAIGAPQDATGHICWDQT